MRIKITNDKDLLARVGGPEYAEIHAGQTYTAEDRGDGWAGVDDLDPDDGFDAPGRSFHPNTFTEVGT